MFLSIGKYLVRVDLIKTVYSCYFLRDYDEHGNYTYIKFTDGTEQFLEVDYDDFLLALTNMLNGGVKNDSEN